MKYKNAFLAIIMGLTIFSLLPIEAKARRNMPKGKYGNCGGGATTPHKKGGQTALIWAVFNDDLREVQRLIRQGADVNEKDTAGVPALFYSIASHWLIAKALIDAGADVNAAIYGPRRKKWTALMFTVMCRLDLTELLIDNGADIEQRGPNGQTPLMFTITGSGMPIAQKLIKSGADLNAQDNDGMTALMHAATRGWPEPARLLVASGADLNVQDNDGMTALMHAALEDFADEDAVLEIMEVLIDNKANLNLRDNDGMTALGLAERENHFRFAKVLRKAGAKK